MKRFLKFVFSNFLGVERFSGKFALVSCFKHIETNFIQILFKMTSHPFVLRFSLKYTRALSLKRCTEKIKSVYLNFILTLNVLCLLRPVHTKNYNYKDNYISVHSNAQ